MYLLTIPFKIRKYLGEITTTFLEKKLFLNNKLFLDYEEVKDIIKDKNDQILSILFLNKENFGDILYESDNTITIDDNKLKKLSNLFYLDLLVTDEPNIINYKFSQNIIPSLYEKLDTISESPKKVLTSKIIIDLIESYKGFGDFDEKIKEKNLEKISEECQNIISKEIKKNDSILYNHDLENFKEKSLDIIYMDIFIQLIKAEKINFEDVYNTVKILEFEQINLTEKMFLEFKDFIEKEENNTKKFFIEKIEDLNNINKINFYYIILKYILKNRMYLYQFQFLLNTRKLLIDLINSNLYTLLVISTDLNLSLNEKLEFIIKIITDSEYYFEKYSKMKQSVKDILHNQELRYIFPLIPIISKIKTINEILTNADIIIKKWKANYDLIKNKKNNKILKSIKNDLIQFFKEEKNKYLLLKIFSDDEYEFFKNPENHNSVEEEEEENNNEDNADYDRENIDENQSNNIQEEENQNLDQISEDFQNNCKSDTSMIIQNFTAKDVDSTTTEANTEMISENILNIDLKMYHKSNKFKVIEYYKVIEQKKECEAFFNFNKNVSKGHYITGLYSEKITMYNSSYEKKLEINLFEATRNIYEKENNNNPDIIELIACCKKKLILITINIQNYSYKYKAISNQRNVVYSSFYKIDDNSYLINGEKGGFKFCGKEIGKIFSYNYTGGIKINNDVCAFISNKLFPQGENKLIIYDFASDNVLKEILDYSFGFTSNGLCSLDGNKIKSININRQILLSSCKKNNRNGFLVINMDFERRENIEEYFYETKDFYPSCICQISNVDNNNAVTDDITKEKNIEIEDTEYFVVGGFDPCKRMGGIKLYKIKFNKENKKINIKYLIDIETDDDDNNFKGFDSNITCITQSKITGNLLINTLDGNVYLFKPPNLECFSKTYF